MTLLAHAAQAMELMQKLCIVVPVSSCNLNSRNKTGNSKQGTFGRE